MFHRTTLVTLGVLVAIAVLGGFVSGCSGAAVVPDRPMPPGVSYTGLWESNYGLMPLRTKGDRIVGSFEADYGGTINGTLKGGVVSFEWVQKGSWESGKREVKGHGYFLISDDGRYIEGRWGYDDSYEDGGIWRAERSAIQLDEWEEGREKKENQ